MSVTIRVILAVLAGAILLLLRRTSQARREVREAESRIARRFYLLQGRVTEIDALVRELDFERRRLRREIRFEPSTRLGEAMAVHPASARSSGDSGSAAPVARAGRWTSRRRSPRRVPPPRWTRARCWRRSAASWTTRKPPSTRARPLRASTASRRGRAPPRESAPGDCGPPTAARAQLCLGSSGLRSA